MKDIFNEIKRSTFWYIFVWTMMTFGAAILFALTVLSAFK